MMTYSDRGFGRFDPIIAKHGVVEIYESSNALVSAVWIYGEVNEPYEGNNISMIELNRENVLTLIDQLQTWYDIHKDDEEDQDLSEILFGTPDV